MLETFALELTLAIWEWMKGVCTCEHVHGQYVMYNNVL